MSNLRKEAKGRECKICGNYFVKTFSSTQKVCSPECAIKLSREQSRQAREKKDKQARMLERKRMKALKEKIKSRQDWLKEAQGVFNQYIRLRDKDLPCISCGRFHQGQYHAGHYRTVKAMPELRFNEDNVHKQCSACNNYLSGNIVEYRINLVKKIGEERVAVLEGYHRPVKWDKEACQEIIRTYKAKIKELNQ